MNRLQRILALILALLLVLPNLPAGTAAAAVPQTQDQTEPSVPADETEPQGETEPNTPGNEIQLLSDTAVVTLEATDTRIHRSKVVKAPEIEGEEYRMGIKRDDLWYDYNTRKVIPSIYNLRELMTDKVGTSSDKGINRYPYVVTKVKVKEAGYYDLGVKINMNAATAVDSLAIVVDGTVHVVHPEKTGEKQTVKAENVYLTAGEHSVLYTSALPQNESEFSLNQARGVFDTYYPWANFWSFTFEGVAGGLEVLDASALTGTDVENIFKGSTRIEAEDTGCVSWNIYNKAESNAAASGDKWVGGPEYGQIQQTFADLTENGLDKAKMPYLEFKVEAPAAGTYYITVGANPGTTTNNANPLPYIAVIANDSAPVKAQFDGAWNGMDSVTVAVELQKGTNVIRCTTAPIGQYESGTVWVNLDYFEVQKGLSVKRTKVGAETTDWDAYLYLNRYQDKGSNFGGPNYADMWWDYPSLYEDMYGIYSDAKPDRAGYWPYIALRVNAAQAGQYQISAEIETTEAAKTIGMIVDGAMYVVDVTTTRGVLTQPVYLAAGEHTVVFVPPIPQDMGLIPAKNDAMYPWMNFYAFELADGLVFAQAPTVENVKASMQNYFRMEAEDYSVANGNYAADISKSYTRRYFGPYTATIKGAAAAVIDGTVTADEKLVNTTQTYDELKEGGLDKDLTSYVQYTFTATKAGTYTIRVGAYLEGSGTMPYGTVLVNGVAYQAQIGGNWNGYYAVDLPVQLVEGKNTVTCIGITADQTASDGWIGYDFVDIPCSVGRKTVSAADGDWADYVYLNKYKVNAGKFDGGTNYGDIRYDFPSLYEPMYGIYSDAKPERAGYWPYIALRVKAEEAGYYQISAPIEADPNALAAGTITAGMIVDGAMYDVSVVPQEMTASVYLTKGEHVIIFTSPMYRDMVSSPEATGSSSQYRWLNYYSFAVTPGLDFSKAPTVEDVKASLQNYFRMEAEDISGATANGSYAADISKDYIVRYFNTYTATVKGAAGAAIDGTATADEKLVNTTQTYAELKDGGLDKDLTSYVQYTFAASKAGTYIIRVGAYLEGSGTMPYGTVLVNGKAYKAQFSGNWNGYDAVNLAVELTEGKNVIACVGITADQTASDGWIGYDFVDIPYGVGRKTVSAADEDWDAYLYLNRYQDKGSNFGGPSYADLWWDYPSLYEDMHGIYSDAKPDRAGYWPYIAMRVTAEEAGSYLIKAQIETAAADTVGMIVDGAMYDASVVANTVTESVYLTKGEHVIIFTTPMPRHMEQIPAQDNSKYPYVNYCSFKVSAGLEFGKAPTFEDIKASLQNYSRMEAEDYATVNGNYAANISKAYTRRYFSPYTATVKGAAGGVIDGTAAAEEKLVNTTQTYAELKAGSLDKALTSYVQYTVVAARAGTYTLRVGAYLEGSGTVPYGTVLVNGKAYKAQFSGSWNGYDVANVAVELAEGENTVQCIGITADQTGSDGWIGYDFVDVPGDVAGAGGRKVSATDKNWADYVYLNSFVDTGNKFGDATHYGDLRYDYPSLYGPMYGIYSNAKPDRAGYWPYIALRVKAETTGHYQLSAEVETATAKTVGIIVDGAVYAAEVVNNALTQTVYLTAGEHVIIFTSAMPRDMLLAKQDNALYPWINYYSIKIGEGLSFIAKPTKENIQNAMSYTRVEAEDLVYATYNANYAADVVKRYSFRYGNSKYMVMGAKGAAIDGSISAAEKKANTSQTFQQLSQGLNAKQTSYVEYSINAKAAGTYMIRVGAYVEGSGTMPYGTVLVNGKAYKAQFSGNWNSYDAVYLSVELQKGKNIIRCVGVTADQTDSNAWIGYDYLEIPDGLSANKTGFTKINAGDQAYVTFNKYQDNGDTLGSDVRGDLQWDRLSVDALNYAYLDRIPYAAVKVTAKADGKYDIYFTSESKADATSKQVAILVDGVTSYPVSLAAGRSYASIYLKKGTHTLVFTTPMPADMNAAAKTAKFDGKAYPWMDYETIILGKGLVLEKAPNKAALENPFVAVEVEGHALPNLVRITTAGSGNGVYLKAQTADQIVKNGIDPTVTPFVQYRIQASEAGEYTLYVTLKSGMSGTMSSDRNKCSFVVENGDTRQVKTLYSFADTKDVVRVIPVTLKLEKGINVVRMTHFTGDSAQKTGFVWNDFDYIEMSPEAAKKLTFLATTVLEAEEGTYTSYQEQMSSGMSGGSYLGKGDYGYIDSNRVTFEALDIEDMGDLSRVTYLFEAEKAGTYTVAVKFGMGLINYKPSDLEKYGFAVIVNGKTKELVEISLASMDVQTTRLITLDLAEGENEVTFTASLADYMKAVSPKIESEYCLTWVDHDALYLSDGLTMGREVEKFGVEDSSVDHAQLELWGITLEPDVPDDPQDNDDADDVGGLPQALLSGIIGGAVGLVALIVLLLIIILIKRKKREEDQ